MELPEQKSPLFDGLLSVIVPCKNEAEMIASFYAEFEKTIVEMGKPNYEIIFVDDGSTDTTLAEIQKLAEKNSQVQYISFTRNFGKE
jgi:glycosyltransferase involved in cell wall biosynthesis